MWYFRKQNGACCQRTSPVARNAVRANTHAFVFIVAVCRGPSDNGILRSATWRPFTKKPQDLLSQQAKRALGFSESFPSESRTIIGCLMRFYSRCIAIGREKVWRHSQMRMMCGGSLFLLLEETGTLRTLHLLVTTNTTRRIISWYSRIISPARKATWRQILYIIQVN